jgi:hypothetical protein
VSFVWVWVCSLVFFWWLYVYLCMYIYNLFISLFI